MHDLEAEKGVLMSDDDKLEVFFKQVIQMSLWLVHSIIYTDRS